MNKNSTNSADPQISNRKYALSATDSPKMEANLEALHLSGFGGLPLLHPREKSSATGKLFYGKSAAHTFFVVSLTVANRGIN